MREPFVPLTVLTGTPKQSKNPECGLCKLDKQCQRPKIPVSGKGKKKILFVTDHPGTDEEVLGIHLAGGYGRMIAESIRKVGVDLREDCWCTSAFVCRPHGKPPVDVVRHCRPNLLNTIADLQPRVIVTLGGFAGQSVIGHLWPSAGVVEEQWAGYQIPNIKLNTWICPTFHPRRLKEEKTPVAQMMMDSHLQSAVKLQGRPHAEIPLFESRIECHVGGNEAANRIDDIAGSSKYVAFDFETTCLKPESPHAEIYTCSVSNGKTSVAAPWVGRFKEVVKRLLINKKILKIGSNIKFEDRWVRKKLGVEVQGWFWDTMLAAHALENNTQLRQITSIKFQAFVHLGVEPWDEMVTPYLKSKGNDKLGNAPNRIKEVDLQTLLKYNALDSLYEFLVAQKQYHRMKDVISGR